jgi:hypothetical protein
MKVIEQQQPPKPRPANPLFDRPVKGLGEQGGPSKEGVVPFPRLTEKP